MNSVFSKWKDKLLDLGRGNTLINFKVSKSKTLEIMYPHLQDVYSKITSGNVINLFDIDNYLKLCKDDDSLFAPSNGEQTKLERVDTERLVLNLATNLKKNEFLAFNKFNKVTPISKNLKKVSNTSLEEKGLNVLYMALGFLKWTEKNEDYYSPIILVPIQIIGNTISIYGENEIVTNPTLVYKLKKELNIDFPEFDEDDENITISQYLTDLKNMFYEKKWEIVKDVHIGIFSFLKMNMYKDYDENEERILENANVTKLLNIANNENKIPQMNDEQINDYFSSGKEVHLHNIVDADSSQLEAILKAKNGDSFVLQGPPGTGKSQTITNLIAEFLYDGKKVLFVSEKLAALNVVHNKLKNVGLDDFCLELHSYKTNKKAVIDELYRVLSKNKKSISTNAQNEIDELINTKNKLDEYCNVLHSKINNLKLSPFEIINELEGLQKIQGFDYIIQNKENITDEDLKNVFNELDKFYINSQPFGKDYRKNAWYGYIDSDLTYQNMYNLKINLNNLYGITQNLLEKTQKLKEAFNLEINTIEDINYHQKLLNQINKMSFFDNNFFKKNILTELLMSVKSFNLAMGKYVEKKKKIDQNFKKEFYNLNSKQMYLDFKKKYNGIFRFLNFGYIKSMKKIKSYLINPEFKLSYKLATEALYDVSIAKDSQSALKNNLAKIHKLLSSNFDDKELCSWEEFEKQLFDLDSVLLVDSSAFAVLDKTTFKENKYIIDELLKYLDDNKEIINGFNKLQSKFDKNKFDIEKINLNDLKTKLENLISSTDQINAYGILNENLNELSKLNALDFLNKALDKDIETKMLSKIYKKMFLEQFMYDYIVKNNVLRGFSKALQNEAVTKYQRKDKIKFEIAKAEIISKLQNQIPSINDCVSGSQVSTLVREANKKRKQKPVRALISEITELIQLIKPCFLMSPLSVSTYLSSNECKFDVVIFDEASQIFPWDAIGAIYRAKQVIIVGDSKQMPPSNFFNASDESEEFEEDDSLDFESVLDLSVSAFSQTSLKWHYRSKTEDLIAFSNKHFYRDELYTFPSVLKDDKDMGVDFYYVEDGIFDRRSKTNLKEAQRVVELVKEHYQSNSDRSLGIVAFSVSQQELIEECLNEEKENNLELQQKISQNIVEPLFIKNLETVQGDERDTIIFSVGYAKDKEGKFSHNFGPLNKKGGERRLNVAVTRARCNVKLVSSITDNDIDLNRTESIGAKLLKEYLYNAKYNMVALNSDAYKVNQVKNFMMDEVAEFLHENGYKTQKNVGYSEQKIDLVVKDENEKYILAIECDGQNYQNAKTTRDRERLRKEVLERMGWNYLRMWSVEWYKNKENEKKELLKILTNLKEVQEQKESEEIINFLVEESGEKTLQSNFGIYEKFNISDYCKENHKNRNFEEVIMALVAHEQPVDENYLLMQSLPLLNNDKISLATRLNFNFKINKFKEIKKVDDYFIIDEDMEILLRIPKDEKSIREIDYISNAEIKAGILKIIELNVGIDKENIIKIISKLLGYKRMNDDIKVKINLCIIQLAQDNIILDQENKYILNR